MGDTEMSLKQVKRHGWGAAPDPGVYRICFSRAVKGKTAKLSKPYRPAKNTRTAQVALRRCPILNVSQKRGYYIQNWDQVSCFNEKMSFMKGRLVGIEA